MLPDDEINELEARVVEVPEPINETKRDSTSSEELIDTSDEFVDANETSGKSD